jgi:hypothetical protein
MIICARVGFYIPPFAMRLQRMGHPGFFDWVGKAISAWRECPHLKIEIWGTRQRVETRGSGR